MQNARNECHFNLMSEREIRNRREGWREEQVEKTASNIIAGPDLMSYKGILQLNLRFHHSLLFSRRGRFCVCAFFPVILFWTIYGFWEQ